MAEKMARHRILIVHDDPAVQALAGRSLAALGLEAEQARNGAEALRAFRREAPPGLILLELGLPGSDGFSICAEIRNLEVGRDVPILAAIDHEDERAVDRAFEAGATDFVSKPLDWQLLPHRIRFLMRTRRALTELRDREQRMTNAQRLAGVGNWEWVPGEPEMLWSDEVYRLFGTAGDSSYRAFLESVHPDDRPELEKLMQESVHESRSWSLDYRIMRHSGDERVVHHQVEVISGPDGRPERVVGTVQDVTDREHAGEQTRQLAYHDSLTGLPNRRMLQQHLGRAIESALSSARRIAVLFVDLDWFKRINDTLGHEMGDRLLKAVAERLLTTVRANDYVVRPEATKGVAVSRLGGDEFTIVLGQLQREEEAAVVARRVLDTVRAPFRFHGRSVGVSASIGIAVHPGDGDDADTLLRNADAAMYRAKAAGRNGFRFFRESINREAERSLRLEAELRLAIEREELRLVYQPQVDATTRAIMGVEALVRWHSSAFGDVEPAELIPLAEKTGLIRPLGEWVLRTACAQQRAWLDAGRQAGRMAVNVSSRQLAQSGLVDLAKGILGQLNLDPAGVELEIAEGVLMDDEPVILETLCRLKELGLRLTLDDFGTGYSSLSRLFRFPIDTLKIDRTFVREIGRDAKADAIIAAVVAMAKELHLGVTAEGVETETQEAFLRDEGCQVLQGYRVAHPLEGDALEELLPRG